MTPPLEKGGKIAENDSLLLTKGGKEPKMIPSSFELIKDVTNG
jgi:hypothetical protein